MKYLFVTYFINFHFYSFNYYSTIYNNTLSCNLFLILKRYKLYTYLNLSTIIIFKNDVISFEYIKRYEILNIDSINSVFFYSI